jgi:uncharacterized MnhB-related membrane protein
MRQYLITIGFLAIALAFYAAQATTIALAVAALGVTLEFMFWIRVLFSRRTMNVPELR